jgi:serine protease Do
VTSVDPASAAAERGLRPGDVIEEINHEAVEHPGDVAKAIDSAKSDSKKPALLLVSNGEGEVRFVAVPVN